MAGREYNASIHMAIETGELSHTVFGEIKIERAIVDDIEKWALENGY